MQFFGYCYLSDKILHIRYSELKYVKALAQGTLASTMLASCPRIHGIHVAIGILKSLLG